MKTVADSAFSTPVCYYGTYGFYCSSGGGSELNEQSFDYDAVGNPDGASVTDGNRVTGYQGYTFTHDDEGRTRTKSKAGFSQTYHWNDRSQVDSVTTIASGDTTVVRYTYDGLGRRITRDGPGGFEEYLYDGDHVIVVLDDNQDVLRTFSYYPGVDRPHSLMTNSETYYYATDPTGSVSGLAEFTGAASVTHRYRYDVWGNPQGSVTEATPNPIRFKARWWDEDTGLADFRSRWYDPEIGRFISEDPIGLAGGINVYRFVGNNPVSGWDPYGLDPDGPDDCEYEPEPYTAPGGVATLEPLDVCVDQGGNAGPSTPVPTPAGPTGFPLPPGGSRVGPGGGSGFRRIVQHAKKFLESDCGREVTQAVGSLALDASGTSAFRVLAHARGARRLATHAGDAGDYARRLAQTGGDVQAQLGRADALMNAAETQANLARGALGGYVAGRGAAAVNSAGGSGRFGALPTVYHAVKLIPWVGSIAEVGEATVVCLSN